MKKPEIMTTHQQRVYLFYLVKQLKLKHDFEIFKLDDMVGRGVPDKTFQFFGIKHHWKDLKIQSFSELINNDGMYGFKWFESIMD